MAARLTQGLKIVLQDAGRFHAGIENMPRASDRHRHFVGTVYFQRMVDGISDTSGARDCVFQTELRSPIHGAIFQRERMARRSSQPVINVERSMYPFAA